MALRRFVLAASTVAALCLTGSAQSPFTFRVVATGLSSPWEVTWGPDGQLWVTERIGASRGAHRSGHRRHHAGGHDRGELRPGQDVARRAARSGPASRSLEGRRIRLRVRGLHLRRRSGSGHGATPEDPSIHVRRVLPVAHGARRRARESSGRHRPCRRPARDRSGPQAVSDSRRSRRQLARQLLPAEQRATAAHRGTGRRARLVHLRRQDSSHQSRRHRFPPTTRC